MNAFKVQENIGLVLIAVALIAAPVLSLTVKPAAGQLVVEKPSKEQNMTNQAVQNAVQQQKAVDQQQLAASKGGGQGQGNQGQGKQLKCNNLKIMALVTGLDTTANNGLITLKGSATLQGQTVQKTITVNTTQTSQDDGIGIPLFFKKSFQPCPPLGTSYSGSVNSTTFSGSLQSLNKPNIAEVDLSGGSLNS